jgi:hypothetical protein
MKFLQLLYYRKRHTQKRKATNFILFLVAKIRRKVPHENIHGEASILKKFQKEN